MFLTLWLISIMLNVSLFQNYQVEHCKTTEHTKIVQICKKIFIISYEFVSN